MKDLKVVRPPFDPELEATLAAIGDQIPPSLTAEMIPSMRSSDPASLTPEQLAELGLVCEEIWIPGFNAEPIRIAVIRKTNHINRGLGIYYTHGGGMVSGNQFSALQQVIPWVIEHDAVLISVDYRLAPEHPDPIPVEDCYAGLQWVVDQAEGLLFDPEKLIIAGSSAGGGLAAGTALLARDRKGPKLAGQVLIYPMLDDRDATVSTRQFEGVGIWDRVSNVMGWTALLGDRRAGQDVSIYAAPARATDLSGLPQTYIDCGSAEVFRDEDVAYATTLWRDGVDAELHVWPGGFHGFDLTAPHTALSHAMMEFRNAWIRRRFSN